MPSRPTKSWSFEDSRRFYGEFRPVPNSPGVIDDLHGPNFFLDNFHYCEIMFEGIKYPSTEHAYQAAKSTSRSARLSIAACLSPGIAKSRGNRLAIRPDWDEVRYSVMHRVLIRKFVQPRFRRGLLATGECQIIEGNTWNDTYWGVCNGVGENKLGELLMRIRENYVEDKQGYYDLCMSEIRDVDGDVR